MKTSPLLFLIFLSFCTSNKEVESSTIDLQNPTKENASLPHLIVGEDSNLYLSWVEKRDTDLVAFYFSMLQDDLWSEPELIASGKNWFVNWADYPMLSVDNQGNKLAHYLAKSSKGVYSYDVHLVVKPNSANEWSDSIVPHKDQTLTEHGFVSMTPNNDSTFSISWLDGRNTSGGHEHAHHSSMTLRSAKINLQGEVSEEAEIDDRTCDCCQTGSIKTPNGTVVVYRDRTIDEVRDISFAIKSDSGWSRPKSVAMDNWNIEGCPVNGPSVDSKDSTVVVAWFTGAFSKPMVKVAFMMDTIFMDPIVIDETSPIGRVDVVVIDENEAIVSWLDGGEVPAIKYRKVNRNGMLSPEYTLAQASAARGSGFPQMEFYQDVLYFAWTDFVKDSTSIKVQKVVL